MLTITRTTRPLVTLDPVDLRAHLRIVGDYDDTSLIAYAQAAAAELEDAAELALLTQTIRLTLDGWPADGRLRLPIGPVQASESEFSVTLDDDQVEADLVAGLRPVIVLRDPLTEAHRLGAFVVTYQAGWPDVASLPPDITHAIKDQTATLYDFRGANPHEGKQPHAGGLAGLSFAMHRVIGRYKGVRA
jgi:uncharacterized phiE125 gp8 family phage protein